MVRIKKMRSHDYSVFCDRYRDKINNLDFPELQEIKKTVGSFLGAPERSQQCTLPCNDDEYETYIMVYRTHYDASNMNREYANLGYSCVYMSFAFYLDRKLKPRVYVPKISNCYNQLTGNLIGMNFTEDLDYYHSKNFSSGISDILANLVNMTPEERTSSSTNRRAMRNIDFGMFHDGRGLKRVLRDQLRPSRNEFVKKEPKKKFPNYTSKKKLSFEWRVSDSSEINPMNNAAPVRGRVSAARAIASEPQGGYSRDFHLRSIENSRSATDEQILATCAAFGQRGPFVEWAAIELEERRERRRSSAPVYNTPVNSVAASSESNVWGRYVVSEDMYNEYLCSDTANSQISARQYYQSTASTATPPTAREIAQTSINISEANNVQEQRRENSSEEATAIRHEEYTNFWQNRGRRNRNT